MLSGVPVRTAALFDRTECIPTYKQGLADLVREYVEPGDHVVEIGGGRGVMSVLAAQNGAEVTSFEPSADMVAIMEDTLRASCVRERVTIREAIVGELGADYGSTGGAEVLPPEALPDCDVLIMDCEGAELVICEQLQIQPKRIIIETHPHAGADIDTLQGVLSGHGYNIRRVAPIRPDSSRPVILAEDES